MMAVAAFKYFFNGLIYRENTGSSVIKGSWNRSLKFPKIGAALLRTFTFIYASYKFAPTYYLPDKAFY